MSTIGSMLRSRGGGLSLNLALAGVVDGAFGKGSRNLVLPFDRMLAIVTWYL